MFIRWIIKFTIERIQVPSIEVPSDILHLLPLRLLSPKLDVSGRGAGLKAAPWDRQPMKGLKCVAVWGSRLQYLANSSWSQAQIISGLTKPNLQHFSIGWILIEVPLKNTWACVKWQKNVLITIVGSESSISDSCILPLWGQSQAYLTPVYYRCGVRIWHIWQLYITAEWSESGISDVVYYRCVVRVGHIWQLYITAVWSESGISVSCILKLCRESLSYLTVVYYSCVVRVWHIWQLYIIAVWSESGVSQSCILPPAV